METPTDDSFPNTDKRGIDLGPKRKNGFLVFIKNLLLFVLLVAIIVSSFWVSFLLGKRILVPVKKTPKQRIELALPESGPSPAALQRLEEVMIEEIEKDSSPAAAAKAEPKKVVKPKAIKKVYSQKAERYYKVQAGVYSDIDNAKERAKKLQTIGFATYIKKVSKGWRIQVGAFYKKVQALHLQSSLSAKGFESTIIYE